VVDPEDVERVVLDAARLVGKGELVVFGSASLSFWLKNAPSSRDVDIWCEPPERGDAVVALMGELSWYHDRHGAFVEVWRPETFAAPDSWRLRARIHVLDAFPEVRVVVAHPHDVLMAKLERMEVKDREHIVAILAEYPLSLADLEALAAEMPHRRGSVTTDRRARFETGLKEARVLIADRMP
jgi:hypothetical protein